MTQIFDKDGSAIPVTLVKADPCQVCQIKTTKTDGYDAIQVGYLEEKLSKISKPIQGHLQKCGSTGYRKFGYVKTGPVHFKLPAHNATTIAICCQHDGQHLLDNNVSFKLDGVLKKPEFKHWEKYSTCLQAHWDAAVVRGFKNG